VPRTGARIKLVGADEFWQALADAALFYLISSTHGASPASTSIFGLATWHDYHCYYGHVMWDIETFVAPVLSLLQPHAAESILDYRARHLRGRCHANQIWPARDWKSQLRFRLR
jgi:protein-glucosylgalactosylhydroxylysine glucosidase